MRNLKEEKLYIQAFREIRGYIIRNNLREGDLLPTEQTLCQMLGVSRNVLREAMKSMELMGMIQSRPGLGTMVKGFNLDFVFQNVLFFTIGEDVRSIREMIGIRRALELSYMHQAFVTMTGEDVRAIRDSFERVKALWEQGVFSHTDDKEFHMLIFQHLSNAVLNSMLEAIWAVDANIVPPDDADHRMDIAKHEAIVTALENGDYPAFAQAMEDHFATGKYQGYDVG